jgi:hypothetical protein
MGIPYDSSPPLYVHLRMASLPVLTAEKAKELDKKVIQSVMDLQQIDEEDLNQLLENSIWSIMEDLPSLPHHVAVELKSRKLVDIFLKNFSAYLDALHLQQFKKPRSTVWEDKALLTESINIVVGYLDNTVYKYKEEEKKAIQHQVELPDEDRWCDQCTGPLWPDENKICNWCHQQNQKAEWQEMLREEMRYR